jgi:RNA polymerase sigma-70 factor, ECF subfamily
MAERVTVEDFAHWVEPHLTTMARYAARRVGPADRDLVVEETLIRAWQRWSTYDEARRTPLAWLLGILTERCRHHRSRDLPTTVVELVDQAAEAPSSPGVDLERAVEGLGREQRQAVDLHYFVGLDLDAVADVLHRTPESVADTVQQSHARLLDLLGDDGVDLIEQRLSAEARRWQDEQPPAPEVPLERLGPPLRREVPWRAVTAGAAAVVLLGGIGVAVVHAVGGDDDHPRAASPARAGASSTPREDATPKQIVPWRDLGPHHPAFAVDGTGVTVTPYDHVSVTGNISGTVRPGDILVFDAALTSPGIVSLHPCPDYTIVIGTHTVTRRLNCAQVPYFASIVRPNGKITAFRPVIPAGTVVFFRMQVTVPDEPGRQAVEWTLDGPLQPPGFSGTVDVTDTGQG